MVVVKSHVKYGGLRKMVVKMLNVDNNVRPCSFKIEMRHPVRSLYRVTNERTFEMYMHHAQQDTTKYSLLVTLEEESVRHEQGSNKAKQEAPDLSACDIPVLKSIPKGQNLVNTCNGVETHVLPMVFGSRDLYEMEIDMPIPKRSHFVIATSPPSFMYVARTST